MDLFSSDTERYKPRQTSRLEQPSEQARESLRVGHLVGIQVPSDMLHFELYDKSLSGPLTVATESASAVRNGVPFMRRKDLVDPTLKLNQWQDKLPIA